MIFLKSDYSTGPLLFIPRVAFGETSSLTYPQSIVRDMTAKNSLRPIRTVSFTIERLRPDMTLLVKSFLNETQGYPVQMDFVPHLLRLKGVISEASFESGREVTPIMVQVDEDELPIFGRLGGLGLVEPQDISTRIEHNLHITMVAPEFILLTEEMILNDLEESGIEEDPSGGTSGGGIPRRG